MAEEIATPGSDKRAADNLNSATDETQVSTEIFEIDEEAMKALTPEERENVLRTKLDKVKQEYVATVKINKTLTEQFDQLSAAAKNTNLPAIEEAADKSLDKTFKVAGKTYGFAFGAMQYKGNKIGPKEILASKELQKTLVDGGFGIVKEV